MSPRGAGRRWRGRAAMLLAALWLAACSRQPVNSPYPAGSAEQNTLYTAFSQRSPKHLDPAQSYSSDESSFTYAIYEPLYGYHYLHRPYRLVPRAAAAIAEPVLLDARGRVLPADAPGEQVAESRYDIRLKPGILFQPHPAFARRDDGSHVYWPMPPAELEGRYAATDFPLQGTRELVADDYVYAFRRLANPELASPIYEVLAKHVVGMRDYGDRLRERVRERRAAGAAPAWLDLREHGFEGVQALDSHTLRIRVRGKYPQFKYWLAMTFTAPIPWEAERFYQQPGMASHNLSLNTWPVGTGPYMMTESRQNQRHVLSRNPYYRGEPYPCEGAPGDAERGLLADCGQPLPLTDRVVFTLEKESVPLMGKFLQGYYDIPEVDRSDYGVAMRVAADDSVEKAALYRDRGLQIVQDTAAQGYFLGFNWRDPVVGRGDTPEQRERNRKLRQAIGIAFDWEQFIAIFLNGQAEVAHGPVPPGVAGHQPLPEGLNRWIYRWRDGAPERRSLDEARQLMREAGYPDGRDAASGRPLILYFDSAGGMGASALLDWMRRQLAAIGIELEVRATDYNRFQDKLQQGAVQMFMLGWMADYPDAENFLFLLYGPNAVADKGGANHTNYQNDEFDRLFEQMRYLDEGPRKAALVARMTAVAQADAPWLFGYNPASGGAYQAWVGNAKPSQMVRDMLPYFRINAEQRAFLQAEWNRPAWWPLPLLALAGLAVAGLGWRAWRRRESTTALGQDGGWRGRGRRRAAGQEPGSGPVHGSGRGRAAGEGEP